jgi:hypothetical protein
MMTVSWLDSGHQFVKGVRSMAGSQNDAAIAGQVERLPIALREPGIPDNGLGNPDGQTVSPFRYLRLVRHIDLH